VTHPGARGELLDVAVVGGGPAGLTAALAATRAGMSVVVFDPRATGRDGSGSPIDKACGEGLLPGAVRALADLGIRPGGQPLAGIRYVDAVGSVAAAFSGGPGLGVRRTNLHDVLLTAVREAGVPVLPVAVGAVEQDGDRVRVGDLTARWLLAADGLHSPLRRAWGLQAAPTGVQRWGQRRHFAVAPWTDHVEVHWSATAEAYVTPVGPDLVGVAVLSSRRASYAEHLAAFPALQERLGPAVTPVRGAGPLRQPARGRVAGRVLLVGDAAGYVDALTGEGISVAVRSAVAAVACLAADRPQDYERQWRRATRRSRWLTEVLVRMAESRLRPGVVPLARRAPRVFAAVVDALADDGPCSSPATAPAAVVA
jgi:flavin-dependent dehydrogenase